MRPIRPTNPRSGDASATGKVRRFFCYEELTTEDTEGILHKGHGGGFIYGMGIVRRKHRQECRATLGAILVGFNYCQFMLYLPVSVISMNEQEQVGTMLKLFVLF